MSTVKSTPPPDPNRSCVIGFNDQTHFDPFLPSSPEEELLPLAADFSNTPSPSHFTTLTAIDLQYTPLSQPNISNPSHLLTNGFHEPSVALGPYDLDGIPSSQNDFLSPSIYPSENGYTALSERSGTPYGEDQNLFDLNLAADSEQDPGLGFIPNNYDQFEFEPTSADTYKSEYTHRVSNGTATHSSHLMSPILTDRASPDSRAEGASPPIHEHSMGEKGYRSKASLSGDEDNLDNMHVSRPMQHTPALTGSPTANSPDRSFVPLIARAASPIVRVESYRRGDSPARIDHTSPRLGSKRRGSVSSFLSVKNEQDLSEDGESDTIKYTSQHLCMPRSTILSRGGNVTTTSEGRAGLDPEARAHLSNAYIPNFKDQEEESQRSLKIADVKDWLARTEVGTAAGDPGSPSLAPVRPKGTNRRQRAKSTGELSHANLMRLRADPALEAGRHIPGPGLLVREDSIDEESDSEVDAEELSGEEDASLPESPPAAFEVGDPTNEGSPDFRSEETAEGNASPPPLFRAKVWQDPWHVSTDPGVTMQPVTSNEAINRFKQCADSIETLSRVATWGTRRLSESDLEELFHRFSFNEKNQNKPKEERRGSFLDAAARLLPKRKSSLLKRKESEPSKVPGTRPPDVQQSKRDSLGGRKESLGVPGLLQRTTSLNKAQKSPKVNTGSAVAAMGNQFATIGTSGSISATGAVSPTNPWTSAKNVIKRSRSRSELRGASNSPINIASLWTKQGGPPMPALASPPHAKEDKPQAKEMADFDDDDDDENGDEKGIRIDFSISADPITPTIGGFKDNARQLNPRLSSYMIDRVAQEQLRRYKKLVDFKVKHAQALSNQKCPSGKHCVQLGGEPSYFPSKSTLKEPEQSHTGFSVTGAPPSDDDTSPSGEGLVGPAQFPAGVPMPPVVRLPAEFECSLCFKVKKFHKPSDWSKHVHEDVQPFTCTFATCAEPKSFKRKADWVRHENERHRQLEWWQCNINECSHKCYRKDNFVQHLVREHKLPEPRVKTAKASKPAVRGPSSQKSRKPAGDDLNPMDDGSNENDQVWKLVDECRHETPKNPKDEPCKFCGNVCSSWKKLTVHLAKHMEQISMPVLKVVQEKDVTPETIISPIEQRFPSQPASSPPVQRSVPEVPQGTSSYGRAAEEVSHMSVQAFSPAAAGGPFLRHYAPSTYPPPIPSQNQPQKYPYPRGTLYHAGYHPDGTSAGSQFNPIIQHGGYSQLQASSSNSIYGTIAGSLTAEPRSTPLTKEEMYHPSVYPVKPHQHQHQQAFSPMPVESPMYVYSDSAPSYPQQVSMNATVQMQFTPMQGMSYTPNPTESSHFSMKPLPTQPQQQQQQQQQQQHDQQLQQQDGYIYN